MSPKPTRPCIVLPGIQGSSLRDFYPIDPITTWSVGRIVEQRLGDVRSDELALDDDGVADAIDTVVNRPFQLLSVAYSDFVSGLRARAAAPVYLFPYDWRRSFVRSAEALVNAVARLRERKLSSVPGWDGTFDFACHSLGGLVFRQFLAAWGAHFPKEALPVGRVVFIATPHQGALDAVETLIRGQAALFGARKAIRKIARTFPSVFELFPRYGKAVVDEHDGPLDIFELSTWQSNVIHKDDGDYYVTPQRLTEARATTSGLPDPRDPHFGLQDRLLVVYGARPASTLRSVMVQPKGSEARWFNFEDADRHKDLGDDTVLVDSARLENVASVEIHIDDVSYIEHPILRTEELVSMHAFLPALDEVQTIVSRFFAGTSGPDLLPKGMDASRFHEP